jgi:hypothetical protein
MTTDGEVIVSALEERLEEAYREDAREAEQLNREWEQVDSEEDRPDRARGMRPSLGS